MRWKEFSGLSRWTQYNHKREGRGSKSGKGVVRRGTVVGVMCFANGEKGNELKNAGGPWKPPKARK